MQNKIKEVLKIESLNALFILLLFIIFLGLVTGAVYGSTFLLGPAYGISTVFGAIVSFIVIFKSAISEESSTGVVEDE